MGIRKFHNKYRASIRVDGKDLQPYFETFELAEQFIAEQIAKRDKQLPFVNKNKKRKNCKAKDLPIGLTESISKKYRNGMEFHYPIIRSIVHHKRVRIGTVSTQYGIKHTRKQAIKLTLKKRQKMIDNYILNQKKLLSTSK